MDWKKEAATWRGVLVNKRELFLIMGKAEFLSRNKVKPGLVTGHLVGYYLGHPVIRRVSQSEFNTWLDEFRAMSLEQLRGLAAPIDIHARR